MRQSARLRARQGERHGQRVKCQHGAHQREFVAEPRLLPQLVLDPAAALPTSVTPLRERAAAGPQPTCPFKSGRAIRPSVARLRPGRCLIGLGLIAIGSRAGQPHRAPPALSPGSPAQLGASRRSRSDSGSKRTPLRRSVRTGMPSTIALRLLRDARVCQSISLALRSLNINIALADSLASHIPEGMACVHHLRPEPHRLQSVCSTRIAHRPSAVARQPVRLPWAGRPPGHRQTAHPRRPCGWPSSRLPRFQRLPGGSTSMVGRLRAALVGGERAGRRGTTCLMSGSRAREGGRDGQAPARDLVAPLLSLRTRCGEAAVGVRWARRRAPSDLP